MIKDYVKLVMEGGRTKFSGYLSIFGFVLLFTSSFFAQDHHNPSVCPYVENSEKTFVGTFQKQTKRIKAGEKEGYTIAEFSVMQPLKGLDQNEDKISALSGLNEKYLKIDELYLIFMLYDEAAKKHKITRLFPVIFLNGKITNEKKLQESNLPSDFKIEFASLPTPIDEKLTPKITVIANGKNYTPKFSPSNIFTVVFSRNIRANVLIEVPTDINPVVLYGHPFGDVTRGVGKTTIKYELRTIGLTCEYKQFEFSL